MDHAVIGGVVAVVVFAMLCLLIVLGRYFARHKGKSWFILDSAREKSVWVRTTVWFCKATGQQLRIRGTLQSDLYNAEDSDDDAFTAPVLRSCHQDNS